MTAEASHTDASGTTKAAASVDTSRGPDATVSRTPARAPETVRLAYVTHKYRPASDFKRPLEYFTGRPENGDDVVLPSHPESRDGHWFTFSIGALETLPAGAKAVLEAVRSDTPAPVKLTFELPHKPSSALTREYHLGLTGADAPAKNARITAWRLTLVDASGHTLASDHRFLWELPPAGK